MSLESDENRRQIQALVKRISRLDAYDLHERIVWLEKELKLSKERWVRTDAYLADVERKLEGMKKVL